MGKNKYILSDKDLMELSEDIPMPEGGTLEDFLQEADVVVKAVQATGVELQQLRPSSRALFLMRAFYLLGRFVAGNRTAGKYTSLTVWKQILMNVRFPWPIG